MEVVSFTNKMALIMTLISGGLVIAAVVDPKKRLAYGSLAATSLGTAGMFLKIGEKEKTAQLRSGR